MREKTMPNHYCEYNPDKPHPCMRMAHKQKDGVWLCHQHLWITEAIDEEL